MIDLTGIADIIAAMTGLASLCISLYLVMRVTRTQDSVQQIEALTNSNFTKMQALLADAMDVTQESAKRDRQRANESEDETS